jgi:hypothetical protein
MASVNVRVDLFGEVAVLRAGISAAMFNGMPAALAPAMALSGRFSGEIRERQDIHRERATPADK